MHLPTHPLLAETFATTTPPPPNKGSTLGSRQLQIQLFDTYCPCLDVKRFRLKDPSFDFVKISRHHSCSISEVVSTCAQGPPPQRRGLGQGW